jgi:GT2 family glycosyltransferase
VELAYRLADAGLKFIFNERAVGYHYAERSFSSWLNTPYAYGVNDVIFAQEKGQTWLLPVIWREFSDRNILVQILTRLSLGRSLINKVTRIVMVKIAFLGNKLHQSYLTNMAYSGLFNLRYYEGVAYQLGGRENFFAGLNQVDTTKPIDKFSRDNMMEPKKVQGQRY